METTHKHSVRDSANRALHVAGLELVRHHHHWDDPKAYIPFEETIRWAKEAGLSVGDYIEATYNVPGTTQETIDKMETLGVYAGQVQRICEIGPGSGRYLEKTLQVCHPVHYEFYETATEWAQWLVRQYPAIYRSTDGMSLSSTPSASIDLVQAHKVFVATPFLTTCRYFLEMTRVIRRGGKIVFDVLTEACMDDDRLEKWMNATLQSSSYPNLMPKQYTLDFFCRRGFNLKGTFFVANLPGITECMVFVR